MKKFLLIFAFFAVSQVLVAQSKDEKAVAEAVAAVIGSGDAEVAVLPQ